MSTNTQLIRENIGLIYYFTGIGISIGSWDRTANILMNILHFIVNIYLWLPIFIAKLVLNSGVW